MALARLEILSRQPFEDGVAFGSVGSYERIDGVMHFAVDPADPANQAIVDLDKAEQYSDGLVHFQAGFGILLPADPSRGNRRLLFDVLNRGNRTACVYLNRAPRPATPTDQIDPGDGFLMRHGWTIAWCGWQWDVPDVLGRTGLLAPQAVDGGHPIEGQVMVSFQPNEKIPDHPLAYDHLGPQHEPYPAAGTEEPGAILFVRDWADGPRTVIARERWRFARDQGGRTFPDDRSIWLEGGFEPGKIYEAVYRTRISPVVGTGLLAVRDAVAFLRHADGAHGNPCADQLDYFYGFGASQSGRFLRHFLYLGLNLDEQGRRVFDGVLPHIAGARRGEFNHRYAQPSVLGNPSFGHLGPFADDDQIDAVTQQNDGLLRRQRARRGVPRVITTNTSTEYWRAFSSLIHTDPLGKYDLEPPSGTRIYHFAGTQHLAGALPLNSIDARNGVVGTHAFNVIDYTPLLRAALVNLDRWVSSGDEPPPSVFPRLGDGTAVRASDVLAAFRAIPGVAVPASERLRVIRRLDLGPTAGRGIGRYPPVEGKRHATYVSAVDPDGNETDGIRPPDLCVPLATYTGWNPRHPSTGGEGQIVEGHGATLPFAATAAERERTGDPRPSIAERYRDRDEYLSLVCEAAEELAAWRYLLPEDITLVLELARMRFDTFSLAPVTDSATLEQ